MDRDVCAHGAPIAQHCARCAISPRSTAGILLREFGSAGRAADYAERIAAHATNNLAAEYARAAELLRSIDHAE